MINDNSFFESLSKKIDELIRAELTINKDIRVNCLVETQADGGINQLVASNGSLISVSYKKNEPSQSVN